MKSSIKYICFGLLAAAMLTACSDSFLEEKKNYEKYTAEIYNDYNGARLRVNSIYGLCLPDPNADAAWNNNCTGRADDQSKSTEEYAGFSIFVDPQPANELSASSGTMVPDYFQYQQKFLVNAWGRIRSINECIEGLENSSLTREQKDELEGQCYFFRAWCYYNFVKWYGGVPIIKTVQETSASSFTPRASARECIEFMVEDLNTAAEMLKEATGNGGWGSNDWGRVTTASALALKGRVLLLWASPLFNRTGDQSRYTEAYRQMSEDLPAIKACGNDLFKESNDINASSFGRLFGDRKNVEHVFLTLFNTSDMDTDAGINNQWERYIRPSNTGGQGIEPSAYLVDMFPMNDGKLPSTVGNNYRWLAKSAVNYDRNVPFYSRDPRFYRTFAFPGVRWAYNGDASQGGQNHNPSDGANYALWNYRWYTTLSDQGNAESGESYGADNLLRNAKGLYVRKRTDDLDLGNESQYTYVSTAEKGGFTYSAAPYVEIRFAEVLLNLAEAACGANQVTDALGYLNQVRQRAGVPDYQTSDFTGDQQAACMSAILLERLIEFAYEGKRFDDMRRWLLFDGGANFSEVKGAPSTWALTGNAWGGNTCKWLGIEPFNNQRRERMEFRTADKYGVGTTNWDGDPILNYTGPNGEKVERCAPLDLRQDLTDQQEVLKQWYTDNLVRKDNRGDDYNSITHDDLYIHFYAKYYFLGFSLGAQNRNDKRLEQTIGWEDNNNGGANGTFDPLADTVAE